MDPNTQPKPTNDGKPAGDGQEGQEQEAPRNQVVMDRAAFNERLSREAAAAVTKLLADAGFKDPEELKAELEAAKVLKTEKLSEQERQKLALEAEAKKAKTLQEKLDAADQRLQALEREARTKAGEDAIREALGDRVKYKTDIIRWARDESPELYAAVWGEDGKVVKKAVEALIKAAETARPDYFALSGQGTRSNAGAKPRQPAVEKKDVLKKVSY